MNRQALLLAGAFALFSIGVMWWAIDQDRGHECRPVPAMRVYADGKKDATTECF